MASEKWVGRGFFENDMKNPSRPLFPFRVAVLVAVACVATGCAVAACGGAATQTELQKIRSGDLDVVVLSSRDALHHGQDAFTIEFRAAGDGRPVDVGSVRANAVMPMGATPMLGSVVVQRTKTPGRYAASADFSMAGTWRLTVEWEGPAGRGSVGFSGTVQ